MSKFARRLVNFAVRRVFNLFPRQQRFAIYRSFVKCDQALPDSLTLKIAETEEEFEACLGLLHDAYVESGFMKPDPSGLRVTIYHALPTTTTLCAKFDGKVVGTISLIREGPFGFPLQKIFDLTDVRRKSGAIAEVSALAVHRSFRRQGGIILFPLMKFMHEYCVTFFDTRHLVIAVNPRHIEMYESLLFFQRLKAQPVEKYDFVNGAPAVGATLDLKEGREIFRRQYASKPAEKNLYAYFFDLRLPNIQLPKRRYNTTNDPVMTPALLDHFFNVRSRCFANLNERYKALLHTIYDLPEYRAVLPDYSERAIESSLRRHPRFSVKCPGRFLFTAQDGLANDAAIEVIEISRYGFLAHAESPLAHDTWGEVEIRLGQNEVSRSSACIVREADNGIYGFRLGAPDLVWKKFVSAISKGRTHGDLNEATRFLNPRHARKSRRGRATESASGAAEQPGDNQAKRPA